MIHCCTCLFLQIQSILICLVLVSFVLDHIYELPSYPSPEKVDPWICSDPLQSPTNLRFNGGCAICVNLRVKNLPFWSLGQLYGMILKEPGL